MKEKQSDTSSECDSESMSWDSFDEGLYQHVVKEYGDRLINFPLLFFGLGNDNEIDDEKSTSNSSHCSP